jgi:hypothetical protein
VYWAPDGTRIVIQVTIQLSSPANPADVLSSYHTQTSESYLVLVAVEHEADKSVYQTPFLSGSQRNFLPGAGEGFPLQSVHLRFEGVIRVEGHLLR